MRIEGVICDLDGTIVDSEGVHMDAWNGLISYYGHTPPGKHWHDDCIGLPDSAARDKTIALFPDLTQYKDAIVGKKEEIFRDLVQKKGLGLAYPHTREKLRLLRDQGVLLAVGTNSVLVNCATSLNASGLAEFFPVVVTIDQVKRGKPQPDIYATAAERLGLSPSRCVVLEDSIAGLESARAAGCIVVGIENTWPKEKLVPSDCTFPTTAAALDWVLAETGK